MSKASQFLEKSTIEELHPVQQSIIRSVIGKIVDAKEILSSVNKPHNRGEGSDELSIGKIIRALDKVKADLNRLEYENL